MGSVLLCACGATSSSTTTTSAPSTTSNSGHKVVLKIGDACLPAIRWFDSHASSAPGSDSVVAHGCTTTELSAALRSLHPEATHQQMVEMEQFTRSTLCARYPNTKLCEGGT
jgi:hypothetical protein